MTAAGVSKQVRRWARSYAPAKGVRTLSLAGRKLLYAENRQRLLELNETADGLWQALARGRSIAEAASDITSPGLSRDQALRFAADAARQWTSAGYLTPLSLENALASGREPDRTLILDELALDLHVGDIGCEDLDGAFGHLVAKAKGPRRRLTVVEHAGDLLFYLERDLVVAGGRDGLVAHLKSILTELYLDVVDNGFLAHGALLFDGERPLMLSGGPGAGKTTLALALAKAGWRYGGDDIVRIGPDGAVQGVPFAAAVKSGSLPLLGQAWPQLGALPDWVRADGQTARYLLPPDWVVQPPLPLSVFVSIARRPGAATRLKPISSLDALGAIMAAAYARRWRMTGEAFLALAERLDEAVCVELEYSDLGGAVEAIREITGVQAQVA